MASDLIIEKLLWPMARYITGWPWSSAYTTAHFGFLLVSRWTFRWRESSRAGQNAGNMGTDSRLGKASKTWLQMTEWDDITIFIWNWKHVSTRPTSVSQFGAQLNPTVPWLELHVHAERIFSPCKSRNTEARLPGSSTRTLRSYTVNFCIDVLSVADWAFPTVVYQGPGDPNLMNKVLQTIMQVHVSRFRTFGGMK